MLTIILIIGLVAAVLVIGIVLIQNPKGGGLAANFSSSTQIFGAQKTSEGVEKLTWIFATIIMLVSLVASSYNGVSTGKGKTEVSKDSKSEKMYEAPVPKSTKPANQETKQAPPADPTQGGPPPSAQP